MSLDNGVTAYAEGICYVGPPTEEALRGLAASMAEGDVLECEAAGRTPLEALALGLVTGPCTYVYRETTGEPLGAFGCVPSAGSIWSLWTERLTWQEQLTILRATPAWVRLLVHRSGRPQLHNWVDIGNQRALEWLRLSGAFTLHALDLQQTATGRTLMRFSTCV